MIGKRIRLARNVKGLTLREVGDALRVTPQAAANWEKSNPQLRDGKDGALANFLGVSLEWLEGRAGTDNEIIETPLIVGDRKRVPLISHKDVMHYAIFSKSDKNKVKVLQEIEPFVSIKGQGFATIILEEDAIASLVDGDIGIFDNGINPGDGAIIYAFVINGDVFNLHLVMYCVEKGDENNDSISYCIAPEGSEAAERLKSATQYLPIAVLVEHRRLTKPW